MITKEISQIAGSGFTAPEDAAAYLIHVDGRAAIVDAGCGNATEKMLENIRKCNVPDAYQDSLKKMLELNADILCEGHYGVFKGKAAVREFISSFMG